LAKPNFVYGLCTNTKRKSTASNGSSIMSLISRPSPRSRIGGSRIGVALRSSSSGTSPPALKSPDIRWRDDQSFNGHIRFLLQEFVGKIFSVADASADSSAG
jgi:hypothetical protein